jgi:hypothetical protein
MQFLCLEFDRSYSLELWMPEMTLEHCLCILRCSFSTYTYWSH